MEYSHDYAKNLIERAESLIGKKPKHDCFVQSVTPLIQRVKSALPRTQKKMDAVLPPETCALVRELDEAI